MNNMKVKQYIETILGWSGVITLILGLSLIGFFVRQGL